MQTSGSDVRDFSSSASEAVHESPPGQKDVIMGRGKRAYNNEGNCHFRQLVREHVPTHLAQETSNEVRRMISFDIINQVYSEGGRFLQRVGKEKDGWWETSPEHTVVAKVRQAMCDLGSAASLRPTITSGRSRSSSSPKPQTHVFEQQKPPPTIPTNAATTTTTTFQPTPTASQPSQQFTTQLTPTAANQELLGHIVAQQTNQLQLLKALNQVVQQEMEKRAREATAALVQQQLMHLAAVLGQGTSITAPPAVSPSHPSMNLQLVSMLNAIAQGTTTKPSLSTPATGASFHSQGNHIPAQHTGENVGALLAGAVNQLPTLAQPPPSASTNSFHNPVAASIPSQVQGMPALPTNLNVEALLASLVANPQANQPFPFTSPNAARISSHTQAPFTGGNTGTLSASMAVNHHPNVAQPLHSAWANNTQITSSHSQGSQLQQTANMSALLAVQHPQPNMAQLLAAMNEAVDDTESATTHPQGVAPRQNNLVGSTESGLESDGDSSSSSSDTDSSSHARHHGGSIYKI